MENKITISELTAMLALATGTPGELCENFLRELFQLISTSLENGETVRIKGLGTFKLTDVEARKSVDVNTGEQNEIPQHKKIVFVASKELAAKVNEPFEMFEAVELADDEELPEDLEDADLEEAPLVEPKKAIAEVEESKDKSEKEEFTNYLQSEEKETPSSEPSEEETIESIEQSEEEEIERGEPSEEEEEIERLKEAVELQIPLKQNPVRRARFGWGFLTGFLSAVALAALVAIIWFVVDLNRNDKNLAVISGPDGPTAVFTSKTPQSTSEAAPADSATSDSTMAPTTIAEQPEDNAVPTKPSDTPEPKTVYDTVSTTRYLTTIAKEHYGNFNLWPIIYEENKAILGHPDRIKPGTRVVVPPLSKYGIDPSSPADIAKMKEKGKQIYARYK